MNDSSLQLVQANERVDSFFGGKLSVIQSPDYFTLSVDALLLADFIQLPDRRKFKYIDFCSGNGAIPLLLAQRTKAKLEGIEIQAPLVDMARRSAVLNGLEEQLTFLEGDLREFQKPAGILYDIISCNPPYFLPTASNFTHQLTSHAIARHEITLTLEDWVKKASQMMREKGKLYIVHRPHRLDDILETLMKYRFTMNRVRFIQPKPSMNANGVLIEAIYGGGRNGMKVEPPVTVHEEDNTYTEELQAIYLGR